jgi:hypothetical protein
MLSARDTPTGPLFNSFRRTPNSETA